MQWHANTVIYYVNKENINIGTNIANVIVDQRYFKYYVSQKICSTINMSVVQRMAMKDEWCPKRHNLTECATAMVLEIAKLTLMGFANALPDRRS